MIAQSVIFREFLVQQIQFWTKFTLSDIYDLFSRYILGIYT